jgi:hypothetical protein
MEESTSIKQLINRIAADSFVPSGIEVGVVSGTSPLTVKIPNDSKRTLYEADLVVPEHLTDYEIEITPDDWKSEETGGGSSYAQFESHSHEIKGKKKITVHGALKKGDKVYLLSYNDGKKYFVIDRVGGG